LKNINSNYNNNNINNNSKPKERNNSSYKRYNNKDNANDKSHTNSINDCSYNNDVFEHSVEDKKIHNLKPFRKLDSSPKGVMGNHTSLLKNEDRGTTALNKKDLNVFLNDRQKFKHMKKNQK